MASAAAPKANLYSLVNTSSQKIGFSHKVSVKFPFYSDSSTSRLVTVLSNNPNLDSIKMDQTVSGFGSGPGSPESSHASPSPSAAIDFLTLCHSLKKGPSLKRLHGDSASQEHESLYGVYFVHWSTKRKGWLNHGINGPESIADHMYRMSLMALIANDVPGVNRERCIKIAIVHDIAEAIVGDITPSDGVPKHEKSRMEQEALDEMCKVLGGGMRAEEIKELWLEYETNSSLEANLVKDFDKVEMILQAIEYEAEHGKILDEFFLSTAGKFQTDIGKRWAAEITSRRNSRIGNRP